MHLITAFQLYGIAIDIAAAKLGQSQLISATRIELVGHAAPLRSILGARLQEHVQYRAESWLTETRAVPH
jgi:hypothetical protein